MSGPASTPFASPGARAEHYLTGFGRLTDALGRVLRERLRRLRHHRGPVTRETMAILREAAHARDEQRALTERTRVLVGRPVF